MNDRILTSIPSLGMSTPVTMPFREPSTSAVTPAPAATLLIFCNTTSPVLTPVVVLRPATLRIWSALPSRKATLIPLPHEPGFLVATVTPNKWFVKQRGKVAGYMSLVGTLLIGFSEIFHFLMN